MSSQVQSFEKVKTVEIGTKHSLLHPRVLKFGMKQSAAIMNSNLSKEMNMDDETKQTSIQLDPKTVREGANLSEDEMADLIGMSVHGYRLWENGQRQPGGAAFRLLGLMAQDTAEIVRRLRAIES